MTRIFLRAIGALALAALLSCGGGGGGGGVAINGANSSGGGAFVGTGIGAAASGTQSTSAGAFSPFGGGLGGGTTDAGGSAAGTGAGSTAAGSASGSNGSGAGTSTASNGGSGDGSGVGSGGTGVSTADAVGIGAVDGFGSVLVNGLRYADEAASVRIEDATELKLGMTARVMGPVDSSFSNGIANSIVSEADLRGSVSTVDLTQGSFVVLGVNVTTDESTVYGDGPGLASLSAGMTLQVWGLPGAPGVLRATRIERNVSMSGFVVSGTVEDLDIRSLRFRLGGLIVNLNSAPGGAVAGLANGAIVRVRASSPPVLGQLTATSVQPWYGVPTSEGTPVQLAGLITDYGGLSAFRVLAAPVDAAAAQITGGPRSGIGNGVRVEVAGVISGGVLRVSKLRIRHVPGTGGPVSFAVSGKVKNFVSASSFRIKSQRIDASGASVLFANGSAASLREDANVAVSGDRVSEGVLIANRISFLD